MGCDRVVCFLCLLFVVVAPTLAEQRTWTDKTGKHKTQAEFVSFEDGKVTLRNAKGKELTLPLESLSVADQAYVREIVTSQPKPPASGERAKAVVASKPKPNVPNNVINSVRGAVYRDQSLKKLREIAQAIVAYELARGSYPASALKTGDDSPGLSWRVELLPFLGETALHAQFNRREPWDSEHNQKLITPVPGIYRSPGTVLDEGYTNYLAVRGKNSMIAEGTRGNKQVAIESPSRTIVVVEVDDDHGVIWTKPDDYDWTESDPLAGLGAIWANQFFAAFGDGSARAMELSIGPQAVISYFTGAGRDEPERGGLDAIRSRLP